MNNSLISSSCRVCQSKELGTFCIAKGWTISVCEKCSFKQVKEKPTSEQLNEIYSKSYFSHNKYKDLQTLEVENLRRLELIKKYVPVDNPNLLDAGCAGGEFLEVAKGYANVWGQDLSDFAIEKAKQKNPELADRLQAAPLEESDFPKESFDVVVMWDVIEHIWEVRQVTEQLLKFVKKDGYLVLSTPNIGAPIARLLKKYWAFMTPPEHLSFFTKNSFHYLFEKELDCQILHWETKGKRANVGFILYKIKRIIPWLIPSSLLNWFQKSFLSKWAIYVPTGDIQYLVIQKK
jgi:2-polyprenyl-3-methyl-5-hydroxy-6-metoxy-1,4-benzoquinol methylase